MRVWDAEHGRELHLAQPYGMYGVTRLNPSSDGKSVRYIGSDKAVYRWGFGDREPTRLTAPKSTPYYTTYTVSPDGRLLAAINSADRKLRLIDLLGQKPDRELATVENAYANQLVFSPDGQTLVLSGPDRSVTFFDVATAVQTRKLMPEASTRANDSTPMILFSRDSRTAIEFDGNLKVIELATGGERLRLPGEVVGSPNSIAWSDDGRLMASAHADGSVLVHDTFTGEELLRRNGAQGSITSVVFSRDGRKLATGGANTTVLMWAVPTPGRPARMKLDAEGAWRDLADLDAARAFGAVTHLASAPVEAVRLFTVRLKPPPLVDGQRIGKLIRNLDDDRYAVREKASEELAEIGVRAEEALKAGAKSTSVEVKRRAEDLLHRLSSGNGLAPHRLRMQRAVEVLEKIGTPAAKALLRNMLDMTKMRLDPALEAAVRGSLEALGETS